MSKQWFVVTGGPSSGKSTLLDELSRRGHHTFPEVARVILDEGIAAGRTVADMRKDEREFQMLALQRKEQLERGHDTSTMTFFDRGMHDTVAYFRHYGWDVPKEFLDRIAQSTYHTVFLLDQLDTFEQDYARTEGKEFADGLTDLLATAYREAGQIVVRVPVMSVAERADFVVDYINKQEAA